MYAAKIWEVQQIVVIPYTYKCHGTVGGHGGVSRRRGVWELAQAAVPAVKSREKQAAVASALSVSSCSTPFVS